ncbi:MAG: hypothetical protein ACPKOI_12810 [Pleomorphochaeta sp.]
MKKKIKITLLLSFFVLLLSSCEFNIPTIDLSNVPSSMTGVLYINYEPGLGTATFTSDKIDVKRGTQSDFGDDDTDAMYLGFYNDAAEFDTDRLTDLGYSISTSFSVANNTLVLICTKPDSPTIKYIFDISPWDIMVSKTINDVADSSYATFLTWGTL